MWLRNKGLITQKTEIDMHSHSFQDTELKLHRYVNDSPAQVVEGLTILRYPVGLRNKGLIIQNVAFVDKIKKQCQWLPAIFMVEQLK